jgi:predicted nucleotidyltransferase
MTVEQLKKSGWIIHECIVGSHLYGTNKEGSDIDIKGVYVLPTDIILSGQYIEQVSDDKQDTTYYEIGRFIELAAKANPNILDVLGSDKITFTTDKWKEYFPDITPYLTTKLRHTFLGYAHSQIVKARGMNKKTNWEKSRMERKTPLDFCYVLLEKEQSVLFTTWCKNNLAIPEYKIGLASVNNFPDIYSMYYLGKDGGIIGENSNDVQLRSIPKDSRFLKYMRFDRNA